MKEKQLNDELTIVGLVLVLLFIGYYLIIFYSSAADLFHQSREAKTIAVELNDRVKILEQKNIAMEDKLQEYQKIDAIVKDIATSWGAGRKD